MIFSDFYKGPRSPLVKLRSHQHHHQPQHHEVATAAPDWAKEEHADLLSRDKVRQKEAIKRYLNSKIRNDWTFEWSRSSAAPNAHKKRISAPVAQADPATTIPSQPQNDTQSPPTETTSRVETSPTPKPVQDEVAEDDGYQVDEESELSGDDADSIYSVVSEDAQHYQALAEWASDFSDEDMPKPSPFRFESPDAIGDTVRSSVAARQSRQRKEMRSEMAWNDGLACFEARRIAWTGAKTVRVRTKPISPISPTARSPRRFFFRRPSSSMSPAASTAATSRTSTTSQPHSNDGSAVLSDASSLAKEVEKEHGNTQPATVSAHLDQESVEQYPVQTLIPLAPPLLPPQNILRASITPAVYLNLYDKVILHNLQPTCPINLADMLRSCVTGWKRDGEWPPRPTPAEPVVTRKKRNGSENNSNVARRMSQVLLGRDKSEDGKPASGFRRSIQRVLGIGSHDHGVPAQQ